MIKKIVGYSLLFFAMIALFLALAGIKEANLSPSFIAFLKNTSREMESWKVAIPNIPDIPKIEDINQGEWYEFAVNALNGIISFLNGLVVLLNFIIMALNTLIQLLEFIFFIIKNLIVMKDNILQDSNTIVVH